MIVELGMEGKCCLGGKAGIYRFLRNRFIFGQLNSLKKLIAMNTSVPSRKAVSLFKRSQKVMLYTAGGSKTLRKVML
jgi:hypothetical protein